MNIVIYMNCCGEKLQNMFDSNKYNILYLANYKKLMGNESIYEYEKILKKTDIFIYQPIAKHKKHLEWYPNNLFKFLKKECKKIRISYYRIYDKDKTLKEKMNRVKLLDNRSDIKMSDFFKINSIEIMFDDKNHPSLIFMNEVFRKLNLLL